MKDYGWLPPTTTKRTRYRFVRRRTLLTLALVATLATSAVVVQQWVWSGQRPHKTLDVDKALLVLRNRTEIHNKRNTSAFYLQTRVLKAIDALKDYEKVAPKKYKAGIQGILRSIQTRAGAK